MGRIWGFVGVLAAVSCGDNETPGDRVPVQSCATLAPTCGPSGTSPCCESPLVPGGSFDRSYDVGPDNAYPYKSFPATVGTFRLDKYEVTVGRFRQFVNAGQGTHANPPSAGAGAHRYIPDSGWNEIWSGFLPVDTPTLVALVKCDATDQTWTDTPGANESLPMNCLDWTEAMAFCIWDGGYLPTEAEWNYAAAGGSEQRAFPWSSPPAALIVDGSDASYCVDLGACGTSALAPVGTKPAGDGRWGQSDLGGNVWEWVLDRYETPYQIPSCNDCASLPVAGYQVHRGGAFSTPASALRGAFRGADNMSTRVSNIGVRCARPP